MAKGKARRSPSDVLNREFLVKADAAISEMLSDDLVNGLFAETFIRKIAPLLVAVGIRPFTAEGFAWRSAIKETAQAAAIIGAIGYIAHRKGVTVEDALEALDKAGLFPQPDDAEDDPEIVAEVKAAFDALDHSGCSRELGCLHTTWADEEYERRIAAKAAAGAEQGPAPEPETELVTASTMGEPDQPPLDAASQDHRYPGARPRGSDD